MYLRITPPMSKGSMFASAMWGAAGAMSRENITIVHWVVLTHVGQNDSLSIFLHVVDFSTPRKVARNGASSRASREGLLRRGVEVASDRTDRSGFGFRVLGVFLTRIRLVDTRLRLVYSYTLGLYLLLVAPLLVVLSAVRGSVGTTPV